MLCAALAVDHAKEPHAAPLAVDVEQVVNRHEQILALPSTKWASRRMSPGVVVGGTMSSRPATGVAILTS